MKKRVLLIQPPFERLMGYSRYYTHIGLLSLAAVIDKAGYDVYVYDADYNPDGRSFSPLELFCRYNQYVDALHSCDLEIWKEIHDVISELHPDVIGLTVLTVTVESARKVAEIARSINSNILILTGGVHATIRPHDLEDFSDYIIQNEGESIIVDIIEEKVTDQIVKGKRIENLDLLPYPATQKIYHIEKYKKRDLSMVISTRGCPNACKFCNSPLIWNRKVVRKSVDYFIEELRILKNNYGITEFYIADDSFSYNFTWLKEFCKKVKKLNITWRCLDRINYITQEKLEIMIEAGCSNIKCGIESGSQRILNKVHKEILIEDVYRSDELLRKNEMNWGAYFMMGFPGETENDILLTQKLIQTISASEITLSIFTPYPGNELYECRNHDYKLFSHHSPNNNFTNCISDKRFRELVVETLSLIEKKK